MSATKTGRCTTDSPCLPQTGKLTNSGVRNDRAPYWQTPTLRDSAVTTAMASTLMAAGKFAALCLLLACDFSNHSFASDQEFEVDDGFRPTVYAGAGVGISRLEPNTSNVEGRDVNDPDSYGGQVNIGVDLFKQLSLELHSADLGSAGLSPAGRINYHIDGISALVYAGGNRDRFKRRGLTAYGRGGFGVLNNSPVGNIPFRTVNTNHWLVGAGLEYTHRTGFGARAELISFDTDVRYGQLGMIYRIGQGRYKKTSKEIPRQPASVNADVTPEEPAIPMPPPPPQVPLPPPPPAPEAKIEPPQAPLEAQFNHCGNIRGAMEGIRFSSGSAHLTEAAKSVLDDLAITLAKCPQLPIIVSAHTDSQGTRRTNKVLSQRRAWAVINYLRGNGVSLARLIPRAFGESEPIDTNNTAEGRRNNRRVELIAR